jgi:hypothetical protein
VSLSQPVCIVIGQLSFCKDFNSSQQKGQVTVYGNSNLFFYILIAVTCTVCVCGPVFGYDDLFFLNMAGLTSVPTAQQMLASNHRPSGSQRNNQPSKLPYQESLM